MSGPSFISNALIGALRLARFDSGGLQHIGKTPGDAALSFVAALVVAPMFIVWVLVHGSGAPPETPLPLAFAYEALIYVGGWLLFPVIVWYVAGAIDRRQNYFHFVAAYNWAAVVQNALFLGLDTFLSFSGASDDARSFFGLVMLMYILSYAWFVARHALSISFGAAVTIVALDLFVALTWEGFTDYLAG